MRPQTDEEDGFAGGMGHGQDVLLIAIIGYVDDERCMRREHGDGAVQRRTAVDR